MHGRVVKSTGAGFRHSCRLGENSFRLESQFNERLLLFLAAAFFDGVAKLAGVLSVEGFCEGLGNGIVARVLDGHPDPGGCLQQGPMAAKQMQGSDERK